MTSSDTLDGTLNKHSTGKDGSMRTAHEHVLDSVRQSYLYTNLSYLNFLFVDAALPRAFEVAAMALGPDEDLLAKSLLSENYSESEMKKARRRARSYKQRITDAINSGGNLDSELKELYSDLIAGSFTMEKKLNELLRRKLRINDYIEHLGNLQKIMNSQIDSAYEKHALMTYYGMFDKIKSEGWSDMQHREKLYNQAEEKLKEDFSRNRLPNLEEKIRIVYEALSNGTKEESGSVDEIDLRLKQYYRESIRKEKREDNSGSGFSSPFEKYHELAIRKEYEHFRNTVISEGKRKMQDSEYITELAGKLLRGGSEETSTLGIKNWLARHYGQEEKAIIKFGIDPTSPDIHLGHAVSLRKLRTLQDEGYYVTLLIGGFTATIGEEKEGSERKSLTPDQVRENAKNYYNLAIKILDQEKLNVVNNTFWWEKLGAADLTHLLGAIGYKKLVRENRKFQNILQEGRDISAQRMIYPFLQGMDSVFLGSHMEAGGTDQRHNIIIGRELQRHYNLEPQLGLLNQLLPGIDGVEKMSKSLGNHISLSDSPEQMYRKLMKVNDVILSDYLRLLTDISEDYIQKVNSVIGLPVLLSRIEKLAEFKEKSSGAPYEFILERENLLKLVEREGENLPFMNGSEMDLFTAKDYKNAKPMIYSLKDIDSLLSCTADSIDYSIMLYRVEDGYRAIIEGTNEESRQTINQLLQTGTMHGKTAINPDTGEPLEPGSKYDPVTAHHLLAQSVVSQIYGREAAERAKERYINKEIPEVDIGQIPKIDYTPGKNLVELVSDNAGMSRSQVQRLLKQGAIKLNGQKITEESDISELLRQGEENYLRFGKGKYLRFDYNPTSS